jgi:hypothetical protein
VAGLSLVAATWRLWIPHDHVPQVPLAFFAASWPEWFQWSALVGLIAGLVVTLFAVAPRIVQTALFMFAAGVTVLITGDQLRMQPWAYQFVILALVLALAADSEVLPLARLFIASFYIYSAITKLDHSFLHTLGQQFLSALGAAVGQSLDHWSERARLTAALAFPIGELAIGLALLASRLRRAAVVGAIVLHVLLLVILGPWGLHHKPGVLLWNAYFIAQDVIVFWPGRAVQTAIRPATHIQAATAGAGRFSTGAARAIALAAIVLPLLGPTTWFDMWPSWGLYASNSERTLLLVHRQAVADLPTELQVYCEAGDASIEPWLSLRIDRWVLESHDAPIYPQNRVQMAIATAIIARHQLAYRARIVRLSLADRWTGERISSVLASTAQIEAASNDYFFNARPRPAAARLSQDQPARDE